jgi:hypothetical protein
MTKGRKSVILLLLVLIGLSGCFEFRIPEIGPIVPPTVELGPYEFFVASMTVNFDTLMTFVGDQLPLDEYRETYPGDVSGNSDWFVMRDTFSTDFDLDMSMTIDPVSVSVTQSMVIIDYSTRTFGLAEPIELQDALDVSALPEGSPVPVDSVIFPPDTSYVNFPMDIQRFAQGQLSVTIQNDLECELGSPISIELLDSTTVTPILDASSDPIVLTWTTPIAPGASSQQSLSLVGVEFHKAVMIVVNGVICGDEADTLINSPEMRTSSFSATGSISGLESDYIEGDLDKQFLADSSTISFGDELNDPNLSVDEVYLDTSHIAVSITNTSDIIGKMFLQVMSIDTSTAPGVQAFSTDSLTIPASTTQTFIFDLHHSSVLLDQDFEYRSYVSIPAQYGSFSASDEYTIDLDFYGKNPGDDIGIKSVDATFTDMEYSFDNMTMDIGMGDLFPEEFGGIEISDIELSLDITSDITIPMTLDINLIGVKNAGADSLSISINQQITGPGGNNHIVFNNAEDLINFMPDSLIFNGSISLDGSGNMALAQNIDILGAFAVPFQFDITEPLSFEIPSLKLQLGELPTFLNDFTGSVEAHVNNSFQFGVDFTVLAARDTNYFNNVAYADCVRTIAEITIPAMDTTTQTLVLNKEDYDFVANGEDSSWLSMAISLTGREDGLPTTFVTTDSITIDLFILAEGTLNIGEFFPDTSAVDTSGGGQ